MSAHFFQGSLDGEIQRELNRYVAPLQDFVHRNRNLHITGVRVRRVDYDSIYHLLSLFDRESKVRQLFPKVAKSKIEVGFFYADRWIKIIPVD